WDGERGAAARAAAAAREQADSGKQGDTVEQMPAPVPTPIGVGPQYHPKPAMHGPCAGALGAPGPRMHLELFANKRVIIVPPRVGVRSARCRARLWTVAQTGVVGFERPVRLGALFGVWGRELGTHRLLSFGGAVRLYVNGVRRRIDPGTLPLRDRDEIVLEVGPFVPPHRSYLFP